MFITKGIVKLHDASIWAESEGEDKGTTFFVELLPSAHTAGMDQLLSLDLALALQSQRDNYPNHSEGDEDEDINDEERRERRRIRGESGGDEYDMSPNVSPDHTPGRHMAKSGRDATSVHSNVSGPLSGLTTPNDTARRATLMNAAVTMTPDGRSPQIPQLVHNDGKKMGTDTTSPRPPTSSPTPRVKRLAYNNISHPYNREASRNMHHRPSLSMPDIGGIGNLVMTARGTHNVTMSTRVENITNMGSSFNSNNRGSAGSRGSMNTSPHNMPRVSEKCTMQPLHILIVDDR